MQTAEIVLSITPENAEEEKFVASLPDFDHFLYSGEIGPCMDEYIKSFVKKHRNAEKLCLIISTPGGDADGAYKAARFLNREYDDFNVLVNGYCKSAGTLFAIGANRLLLTENCEFGPLDVQLFAPDEFMKRSSGMSITQAMEWIDDRTMATFEQIFLNIRSRSDGVITTKTAGDIATEVVKGLYSSITEKIDPNVIGEIKRSTDIAYHYGKRLGAPDNLLHRLIEGYPSHGFVIDVEEALDLFSHARLCDASEMRLIQNISSVVQKEYRCDYTRFPASDTFLAVIKHQIEKGPSSGDDAKKGNANPNSKGKKK